MKKKKHFLCGHFAYLLYVINKKLNICKFKKEDINMKLQKKYTHNEEDDTMIG